MILHRDFQKQTNFCRQTLCKIFEREKEKISYLKKMTASSQHQSASGATPEGLRQYYVAKIEGLQLTVAERNQNLRRLQAQRNELNAKVRMLSEELQLLVSQQQFKVTGNNYPFLPYFFLARTRLIRG